MSVMMDGLGVAAMKQEDGAQRIDKVRDFMKSKLGPGESAAKFEVWGRTPRRARRRTTGAAPCAMPRRPALPRRCAAVAAAKWYAIAAAAARSWTGSRVATRQSARS